MKQKLKTIIFSIIVFLSLLILWIPDQKESFIFLWEPEKTNNTTRLPLVDPIVESLSFEIPCKNLPKNEDWLINSEGNYPFLFSGNKDYLKIKTTNRNYLRGDSVNLIEKSFKVDYNDNCAVAFSYNSKDGKYLVRIDGATQEYLVPKNTLLRFSDVLAWNPQIKNSNVKIEVTTTPLINYQNSSLKNYTILMILALALLLLLITFQKKMPNFLKIKELISNRFNQVSFIYLIVLGFVVLPKTDDGGYLISAWLLKNYGLYSIYYVPVTAPTGYWQTFINSLTLYLGNNLFILRIPALIVLLMSWLIINAHIKRYYNKSDRQKFTTLMWFFWALTVINLITLRPEPFIFVLGVIALHFLIKGLIEKSNWSIVMSLIIAAIAPSIHQLGLVVSGIVIGLTLHTKFNLRFSVKQITLLFFIGFSVISIVYFGWQSPSRALAAYSQFNFAFEKIFPGPYQVIYPPWQEFKRLDHLLYSNLFPSIHVFTSLLILLLIIFFIVYGLAKPKELMPRLFALTSLGSIVGLALVPTKWGLYYPVLFFIIAFGLIHLEIKLNKLVLIPTLIAVFLASVQPWRANDTNITLRGIGFEPLPLELLDWLQYDVLRDSLLISGVFAIGIYFFLAYKQAGTLLSTFAFLVSFLLGVTVTPQILDSIYAKDGWTFTRQTVNGFWDSRYKCGMLSDTFHENPDIFREITSSVIVPQEIILNPCITPLRMDKGVLQQPLYGLGPISPLDFQRLAYKTEVETVACNSLRKNSDNIDTCVMSWKSQVPYLYLYE